MRESENILNWDLHLNLKTYEAFVHSKKAFEMLVNKNELEEIPGVGKKLAEIIGEFLDTGKCEKLERLKTEWLLYYEEGK